MYILVNMNWLLLKTISVYVIYGYHLRENPRGKFGSLEWNEQILPEGLKLPSAICQDKVIVVVIVVILIVVILLLFFLLLLLLLQEPNK